jgi:hypothetical protein
MANSTKNKSNKASSKRSTNKRELVAPKGDKRYMKRNSNGQLKESDDQSRLLSRDRKKSAKTNVKPGYGDKGDK